MATLDENQNLTLPVHQKDTVSKPSTAPVKLCDFKSFLQMDTSALDPGRKFVLAQRMKATTTSQCTDDMDSTLTEDIKLSLLKDVKTEAASVHGSFYGTTIPQIILPSTTKENMLPHSPMAGCHLGNNNMPRSPANFGSSLMPLSPIPVLRGYLVPTSPVIRKTTFQPYSPCSSESQYSTHSQEEDESLCFQHEGERELADVAIEKSLHEISMRAVTSLKESDTLNQTLISLGDTEMPFSDDQIVPHLLAEDLQAVARVPQHLTTAAGNHILYGQQQYGHSALTDTLQPAQTGYNPSKDESFDVSSLGVNTLDQVILQEFLKASKQAPAEKMVGSTDSSSGDTENPEEALVESNDSKRHTCTICGVEFKFFPNLSRHMRNMHKSALPLKCDDCSEEFTTLMKLQKHKKVKHQVGQDGSETKDTVVCPICGIEYSHTYYRRVHQKFHNGIRYACQICGRAFTHPQNMWRHYKLHEGPENYKFACQLCGLACKSELTLRRHMDARHKETKTIALDQMENQAGFQKKAISFSCSICSKEFATKQALYCHLRVHNKNKPVKEYDLSCGVCHKAYKVWGALKKHCNTMHNGMGLIENELKSTGDVDYPYVVVQQKHQQGSAMDVDVVDALKNVSGEKNNDLSVPENSILHEFVRFATAVETYAIKVEDVSPSASLETFGLDQTVVTTNHQSSVVKTCAIKENDARASLEALAVDQTVVATNHQSGVPKAQSQPHVAKSGNTSEYFEQSVAAMDLDEPLQVHYSGHIPPSSTLMQYKSQTIGDQLTSDANLFVQSLTEQTSLNAGEVLTKQNSYYNTNDSLNETNVLLHGTATANQSGTLPESFIHSNSLLYSALGKSNTETISSILPQAPTDNWSAINQIGDESVTLTPFNQNFSQARNVHVSAVANNSLNNVTSYHHPQNSLMIDPYLTNNEVITIDTARRYGRPKGSKNKKRLVKDGKTYFQCEYCEELFLSRPGINNHLKSHEELQNYGKIPTSRMVRKMVKNAKREQLEKEHNTTNLPSKPMEVEDMNSNIKEAKKVNVSDITAGLGAVINQYVETLAHNEQVQTGNCSNIQKVLINALNEIVMKQTNAPSQSNPNSNLPVQVNKMQMTTGVSEQAMSPIEEAFRIATADGNDGHDFLCASTPLSMINESFDRSTVISDEGYNSTEISDVISDVYDNANNENLTSNNNIQTVQSQNQPGGRESSASNHHIQSNVSLPEQCMPIEKSGNYAQGAQNSFPTSTTAAIHPEQQTVSASAQGQGSQQKVPNNNVRHQCPHCDAVFKKTAVLQKHIQLHMKQFANESK